ncbi:MULTISPECIES: barstar family protein [unclassified Exiguobacterium]|uniref:barstar family protein n=1 Tax=unclassified Exiguobacterium TaxID=2644629 RepID=UPI001BE9570D|nr:MULTISPECIES: barstar family protein [unclassified Exiguobacterium]
MSHLYIDLSNVTSTKELHQLLKESLHLPDHYGKNWDVITDVDFITFPERITFIGYSLLETKLSEDAKYLKMCLEEYDEEHYVSHCHFVFL